MIRTTKQITVMTRAEEQLLGRQLQSIINNEVKHCLNDFNKFVIFFKLISGKKDHLAYFHTTPDERQTVSDLLNKLKEKANNGSFSQQLIPVIQTLNFSYDGVQLLRSINIHSETETTELPEFKPWDHLAQQFIIRNQALVMSIAKTQSNEFLDIDDLFQEGNLGLMRAVQKFNYLNNFKFSTYATLWIRQAISRGIQNKGRMIRLPAHIDEKLKKARQYLYKQYQVSHDYDRVASEIQISDKRVLSMPGLVNFERVDIEVANKQAGMTDAEIIDITQCGQVVSMSTPITGTDGLCHENLVVDKVDVSSEERNSDNKKMIHNLLSQLPSKQVEVLSKRFGLMNSTIMNLEDIAADMQCSRETIRRLEKKATKQLSEYMLREGYSINDFF